ncbi:hypothetical protein [Thalassobacillus hwangdonensis]|uniref:Uncharacterized protein n=1 Tax=Thalassobacillus hwangdonensis TaxID=546108 RepID=A0ABW3L1R0_9BACI
MIWHHLLHSVRFPFVLFFSFTALSLLTFQTIEITQAFIDYFIETFRRK